MIEAFQIGVSLAVDTDDAHAALAGFGRRLSSLDQSIAQTHRRMSEMRAALSMPDDISGNGRVSELSQSLTRRDARSQPGTADPGENRSLVDQMTTRGAGVGGGSSEEVGRLLPGPQVGLRSDAADARDFGSLLDVLGAADQGSGMRGLPWSGRPVDAAAAPEKPLAQAAGAPPPLDNASVALPTWHEPFAMRHQPEPIRENVAAPPGGMAAFDLSSFVPRLEETLAGSSKPDRASGGEIGDSAVPNTVPLPAWPFDRHTAETGKQLGAVSDQVAPRDFVVATGHPAPKASPIVAPEDFSPVWLRGLLSAKGDAAGDARWSPAANGAVGQDPASMVPGEGLEAALNGALSWLGRNGSRGAAPATMAADAMGWLGDRHSDLLLSDGALPIGQAEADGAWGHEAVASGARQSLGGGEVTSVAVPAEPPALPFGLPLLPPALWGSGEGEKQTAPPSSSRQGVGFIGTPPGDAAIAVKHDLVAPLPPVFGTTGSQISRAGEEAAGQEKGSERRSTDERGESAGDRPIVVHTNVQIDGDIVARAVTHRMVGALNGPLAGSGGFDPRRSYTPVES